jgi:hypothetical protein
MAIRRRTSFVAPFIVSVTACGSSKEPAGNPPPPQFPGATWSVRMHDMKCYASVAPEGPGNPPAPREIECPPGMSGNTALIVGELKDKECGIVPAGCTDASCVKIRTPCPLPHGQHVVRKLMNVWTIEKRKEGCHAEEGEVDCPPGVDCNPPQPRMIACPEGITEAKNVRIAELPDATCVIVPDGCDDTSCVGAKTLCPTQ